MKHDNLNCDNSDYHVIVPLFFPCSELDGGPIRERGIFSSWYMPPLPHKPVWRSEWYNLSVCVSHERVDVDEEGFQAADFDGRVSGRGLGIVMGR